MTLFWGLYCQSEFIVPKSHGICSLQLPKTKKGVQNILSLCQDLVNVVFIIPNEAYHAMNLLARVT